MIWYDDHMSGWGYGLLTVSMLVFWGVVIAGIVVLVRYFGRSERRGDGPGMERPTAEQVLAERFARGDIDEEEYHRRLDTLFRSGGAVSRP